jgi:maleate isomerase
MTFRIGMIYPAAGRSEKEFERLAPSGVEVHITRISFEHEEISQLLKMENNLEQAAELLGQVGVDIILFNCTTGSLIRGRGYDRKLIGKMEAKTGIQSMTTATAVLMALEHLGAKRISLITAYPQTITEIEVKYLEDNGFEVIRSFGANITDPFEQAAKEPSFWYGLSLDNFAEDSDVLFISCAGIKVVDYISVLEKKLGVPVLTSNQAAMWACLQKIKTSSVTGFGKLFYS